MAEIPKKHRMVSDDMKRTVITWRNEGKSYEEISSGLGVPASTAHGIMKRLQRNRPGNPHGRPKVIDPVVHMPFVVGLLEEEATRTLKDIQRECQNHFGVHFSLSSICHVLDEFHYSFKRVTVLAESGETPENMQRRVDYANTFSRMFTSRRETLFFMDEVGFLLSMRCAYGYSPWGTRPTTTTARLRSKNLTVMALIGLSQGDPPSKVLIWKLLPQAGNTVECRSFLTEVLEVFHTRGIERGTIVLDNARFHHSAQVVELFPEGGPFELLFLPPYTPDFLKVEGGSAPGTPQNTRRAGA